MAGLAWIKGGPHPLRSWFLTDADGTDSSPGPLLQPGAASFLALAGSLAPIQPVPKPTRKNDPVQTQAPKSRASPLYGGCSLPRVFDLVSLCLSFFILTVH